MVHGRNEFRHTFYSSSKNSVARAPGIKLYNGCSPDSAGTSPTICSVTEEWVSLGADMLPIIVFATQLLVSCYPTPVTPFSWALASVNSVKWTGLLLSSCSLCRNSILDTWLSSVLGLDLLPMTWNLDDLNVCHKEFFDHHWFFYYLSTLSSAQWEKMIYI